MPRLLLLLTLVLTLPACQRPPMVLATMFETGMVDPLADTPEARRSATQTIFYVTDRTFDSDAGPFGTYTRHRSDVMDLGQVQFLFGHKDAWPRIVAATQNQTEGKLYRPKITGMSRYGTLPWSPASTPGSNANTADPEPNPAATEFLANLQASVQQSADKEITIFIHGFKSSFSEAALTTAEYGLYAGGLGPFILYSWPSYDDLFEYSHDRDSVRYTTAHARRFVEFLADAIANKQLDAKKINLVAHSSGAEVVGTVLRELALMSHALSPEDRRSHWRIGAVLLVAADISADVARQRVLKEDLTGLYEQICVYISQHDTALGWAAYMLYRTPRIGSIHEEDLTEADRFWLKRAKNVALINIDSQTNGDVFDHSHHRYSPAVVSDILLSLRSDLTPEQRGLVRDQGDVIWRFAEDYPQRVTEAAIKAYDQQDRP